MGALTLKSFPHESRGWEIKNFDYIDPTDGYGSETQVYVNRRRILFIEPGFDGSLVNSWLSDKSRHVFDGAYRSESIITSSSKASSKKMYLKVLQKFYFLEHFFTSSQVSNFLTIIFGNVGLETLSLLKSLTLKFSFVNFKSTLSYSAFTDFESDFQLNGVSHSSKLKSVDICLLLGTNSRFESFRLNLLLRKRIMKGGFSCLSFSSLTDLTFATFFKNSNSRTTYSIAEGTHLLCQELTESKSPLIVLSSELLKNSYGDVLLSSLQQLSKSVNGSGHNRLNVLNSDLCEAGGYSLGNIEGFSFKDLVTSRMFYFAHSNLVSNSCLKQASEMSLLNSSLQNRLRDVLIIDQNHILNNNIKFSLPGDSYTYLPACTFYENDETYCSTEGLFKRTSKLFVSNNALTTWQTILVMLKYLSKHLRPLSSKSHQNLSYSIPGYTQFRVFTHLHFYTSQNLSNINFYLASKTLPITNCPSFKFKQSRTKTKYCKLKLWLDDFFTGGKDEYSRNSATLLSCSIAIRLSSLNF
jgi:NADH dehydrogenase/NADH:ubiquinone oxidoreductase subunit G